MHPTTPNRRSAGLLLLSLGLFLGMTPVFAQTGSAIRNPTFTDADGDGTPDGWNPYPPGNGDTLVLAAAPGGGLIFKDNDKNAGLGMEQWVAVTEGLVYTATAEVTGTGAVSLTLIFAKEKPQRVALSLIHISEPTRPY